MIRRAETDADFALCASIKNAVQPSEPVTAVELRDDPGAHLFLLGEDGYAVVKESSLADCAFAMVRVAPEARRQGADSALLAVCSDEARALELAALYGRVDGEDDASLGCVEAASARLGRRGGLPAARDLHAGGQRRDAGAEPRARLPGATSVDRGQGSAAVSALSKSACYVRLVAARPCSRIARL